MTTTQEAKQIQIIDYLAYLSYNPKKQRGNEYWYLSPLRREDTPSFKVDIQLNLWYDHGTKQGGSIIDLVMYMKNYTIKEALEELENFTGTNTLSTSSKHSYESKNTIKTTQENKEVDKEIKKETTNQQTEQTSSIKSIKPLNNEALIEYLQSRNINPNIAKHYLQEVYYQVDNQNYFALGFKNNSNGYELRNKFFKGSLKGTIKDITTIIQEENHNQTKTLLIFEGFMDFFSLFTVKNYQQPQDLQDDILVLNSLSMLDKTINWIKEIEYYSTIKLYLDNDTEGRKAVNKIMFSLDNINILDMSNEYKGKKDLNEGCMESN